MKNGGLEKVSIIVTLLEGNVLCPEEVGQTNLLLKVVTYFIVRDVLINYNDGKEGQKVNVPDFSEIILEGKVLVISNVHNKMVRGHLVFCFVLVHRVKS